MSRRSVSFVTSRWGEGRLTVVAARRPHDLGANGPAGLVMHQDPRQREMRAVADTLDNIWPQCGPDAVTMNERFFKQKDCVETYLGFQVRAH